jgi:ATP-dependent helicase HepA
VVEPGDEAFLADLYEHEIGIFDEPVGGLDAVLASLPEELEALRRKRSQRTREAFREALAARVAAARKAQHEGDPLLDIRSASLPELGHLVRAAFERLGDDPPEGVDTGGPEAAASIEQALVTLSRWLEEELEDVVVDVGRRVGMEVDTDQNVHPFEAAFTIGAGMKIEALPGMTMPDEPVTHLGSFWRETAVARDELQWFATGHRLVEALVGIVRDGDAGRSAAVRREWAPRRGGLYVRFIPALATAADVAPGARVASRQASRYVDLTPISVLVDLDTGNRTVSGGAARLEDQIDEVEGARVGGAPPELLEAARAAAEREVGAILARRVEEGRGLLAAHADREEERLVEAGFQGGAPRPRVEAALTLLRQHREVVEKAIGRARLELDAVALVLP